MESGHKWLRCFAPQAPVGRRRRADRWTDERRVTFIVTLAASGSVTFATASAGLSRKSAYALKKRDAAFASLWKRSIAAASAAGRKARGMAAKGDERDTGLEPLQPINFINRGNADIAARDRFFAGLESGPSVAFSRRRVGPPLAKFRKESDAIRLESASRSTCDSAPPPTRRKG